LENLTGPFIEGRYRIIIGLKLNEGEYFGMTITLESQVDRTEAVEESKSLIIGTEAYNRFTLTIYRINNLLKVSTKGLQDELQMHENLINKLEKGENGEENTTENTSEEEKYSLSFTYDEVSIIKKVLNNSQKEHAILDRYIYSIVTVFVWGTFETYLNQAFTELFKKQPLMLKTEMNTFSTIDILENIEDPLTLLINREINKVGHFKLTDWSKYLTRLINFEFEEVLFNELKGIYLIRNIIAHNTGIVRPDQFQLIPTEVQVIDNEIVIAEEYLLKSIKTIEKVVLEIEEHLRKKFFKQKTE
jgi:hypothetical protein